MRQFSVCSFVKKAAITISSAAIVFLFNLTPSVEAQTVASYAFTQAAGTYTAIAGTTVLAAGADDDESALTNIGFTFTYHCVNYTQFSASANGYITLGSVPSSISTPLSSEINSIAFAARDGKTNGAVTYLLSGTAPNRVLTIQYPNWYVYYSGTTETLSAQIKLYETTNVIKIIYGPSAHTTAYTPQAGLSGAAVTDYNIRTTTTNWSASTAATSNTATMTWSSTVFPANGLTYTWTPSPSCSGTPAPGATLSTLNPVCSGTSFTLSMANSFGCGTTFQWQSSPDNLTWTNIAGATSATYTATQTASTYYRCYVTCTLSSLSAYSNSLNVTMAPPMGCYCASAATSTSDMDITKIIFGTINNASTEVSLTGSQGTATGTAGMYSNWRGSAVPVPSFMQGSTNSFSVTINNAGATAYSHRIVVYIDFNQDGDFTDSGESFDVFAYANPTMPNTTTYNITIPLSALTGNTVMRIVCVESTSASPCGTYTWGETEDYTINITSAPPCSGTPTGGTTTASTATGCGNVGAITVTSSTVATGLTYQWYSSPTGGAPWTLIPGATGETYTPTVYGLYYRRVVTCTASGFSANSSSFQYNSSAPVNDNCENATSITPSATTTCTSSVAGTVACASESPQANSCAGTGDDDDVWYKFTATANMHIVKLTNVAGSVTDMYFSVYSGTCGALTSIGCSDADSLTLSGMIIGQTYYIRVYTYTTGAQTTTFNICVASIPPPPVQPPCTNLGFESGFTGWYGTAGGSDDGATGAASPTYVPTLFNNTSTTQTTLVTAGNDPYGGFPMVFSGTYSARIGNSSTSESYSAGSLQQTFLVNSTNTDFSYSYAVVLQDGGSGHDPWVQPYFTIGVYDQAGNEITCGMYLMTAPGVGYILASGYTDVYYKPWSTVSVNLSAYIGQNVTIKITASDCAWEAHFGYAYIDCSCAPYVGIINPAVICAGQSATLTAPAGAASYSWTPGGQTTQAITVNPAVTTNYTCNMTTSGVTPCPVVLTTTVTVNAAGSVTASSNTPICTGTPLNLTSLPNGATSYVWSGPNSYSSNVQNPTIAAPTAAAGGNYTVTATFPGGCTGTATTSVVVSPNLAVTASSNSPICQGSALNLSCTPAGATTYAWTGPNTFSSSSQNPTIAAATPAASGTYTVNVTGPTGCTGVNTTVVTVNATNTITLTSAAGTNAQTLCINTPIANISYATTGATGATFSGLPAGVNGNWAGNVVTISGTPTASGTFNYTVTLTGGCGTVTATGTITVNPVNTITLTSAAGTNAQTLCINTPLTNITYATTGATGATFSGLPAGVTGNWAGNVVTISGTPTASGPFNYTITLTGGCGTVTATGTITVNPVNTITLTSAAGTNAQTLCINTPLTNITYATTGATGATFSGLPAGVTGNWAGNVVTISGTPTASGPFNYTITLTGGCGTVTATGTITVNPVNTITLTSAAGTNAQTLCINTPLTNITYATTGATGATFSGLPAGINGNWAGNVVTISGTPTASGPFNYSITLTGGCGTVTATGTITVNPVNTITLTSAAGTNGQTLCINTPLTNITYATTGATGATFSGLPAGVTGNWAGNVVTISGTPTASGPFNYTITLTGGCGTVTATGTITVNPVNTITLTSAAGTNAQTLCINTPLTNITYATTGATGATFSGLPAGVTGNWAGNVVTISGTPTASGSFNYTVTLTGGCGTVTATGTITVNPVNTITLTSAAGTNAQTLCINTPLTNITYATTGATGATFSGLPAGVNGNWAGNVVTISGTPTASGPFNYTITLTGGCGTVTATGTITVNPVNTITLTSAAGTNGQTLCINTPLTNITYATTGATGATFSGLPAGVTGNWAGNVVTISGTPTASGPFNYTITLTGGCGTVTATGTITVTPVNTITLTSAAATTSQSICINTPLTNITYATTGATGATFSGLPAGVTGNWAANVVTISGTPTASGTFNYTVTLAGGCGTVTATGTINVVTANTITLTSAAGTIAQTLCINTPLTNITYATTGATGATFSGLPAGVNGNWAGNVVTISGTPTASGTFNYTVTTTGGCGVASASGSITVNPVNTITLTSAAGTNAQTLCINTPLTNITYSTTGATGATFSGLPAGVTGNWAGNVVTISGTPTVSGPFNYTITLTGGCGTVTATGTITVNPVNTITLTSAAGTNGQTLCINTPLTNITYATTGATGATFSGLPAGVNGNWAGNVVTISGTPTASGPFNYTITLTGGCGTVTATGTITVNPVNTITLTSAAGTNGQTLCINTPLTNITYATTGATGATFSGLPTGVTGNWAGNVVTINGTPTASGPFNYTITLTGGCGTVTASGTITVNPVNTITLTSAAATTAQSICINTPLTNITYATTGATGATFSGLPAGVTGNWAANVVTISGTPTASGTFNYTVTLTGGCGTVTASGTINVVTVNTITLTSAASTSSQTLCINTPLTNITYATTGATGATVTGLPTGVTGNWAANVFTISGTPTASGTFNYTVTTTGGCGVASASGSITVNPVNTITLTSAAGTNAQTLCINTPLTNITYATTGATGATFSGLPAGITGNWAGNVVTISGTPTVSGPFNYTITLTGGCGTVTATGTITINPVNTITLTSAAGTNGQTLCINTPLTNITYATTGATGATFSGLPAGITGNWAGNVVTISGTPTVSGPFNYTITLTGGCGTVTATGTITVNPANTMVLSSAAGTSSQTLCVNTPLTNITYATTGATGATITGLPAGVTGNWAGNVVTISGTPTASGTFNYTVSTTGGCGVVTATGSITINPVNTIALTSAAGTNAQSICINTPLTNITYATTGATGATITGLPAGITGNWAGNVVTISGTPTAAGTFNYTITLTGGCGTVSVTGSITVVTANTITLTSAAGTAGQTLCVNSLLTNITYATTGATGATVTGLPSGVTGSWSANVFTISGTPAVSGTFNYTVTTTGGCGVATASGSITINPVNTINLTSAAGSSAQSVCVNAAITNITYATTGATGATITGLPAGVTGNWAANVVTISGTPSAAGTFNYTITLTGGCGNVTANGTITVNPIPVVSVTPQNPTICINNPVTLTASGANSYVWTPATGLNQTIGNIVSASPIVTTTYTVQGTTNNCSSQAFVTVNVYTSIPVTVTPVSTSVCPGESTTLTASGGVTYVWSPAATLSPSTGSVVTATPTATTVYTVIGSDLSGCSGSAFVSVNINPLANITFVATPKAGCEPLDVDFLFSPGDNFMTGSWYWTLGDGGTATDTNVLHTYTQHGTYPVTLSAQTIDGCEVHTHDTIRVYPVPVAEFIAHPDVITTDEPQVNFVDNSSNATQWSWNFGDPTSDLLNTSGLENPLHNYYTAGEYTVTLSVSNQSGCTDTATRLIIVHDPFAFWIPNAFSPNEDLVNDVFAPSGIGYKEDTYLMRIFDRWGREVFFTKDLSKGWDGKDYHTGKMVADGVYTYQIRITDQSNHTHEYIGSLTLLQ
jgi:gliding motility-associated-like protein